MATAYEHTPTAPAHPIPLTAVPGPEIARTRILETALTPAPLPPLEPLPTPVPLPPAFMPTFTMPASESSSPAFAPFAPSMNTAALGVPPELAAVQDPETTQDETDFQATFQEFLDIKRNCGEPTEGIVFDKFAAKLRQNRDQLIARYSCKSVKFQVYIKDGKAALKATPGGR